MTISVGLNHISPFFLGGGGAIWLHPDHNVPWSFRTVPWSFRRRKKYGSSSPIGLEKTRPRKWRNGEANGINFGFQFFHPGKNSALKKKKKNKTSVSGWSRDFWEVNRQLSQENQWLQCFPWWNPRIGQIAMFNGYVVYVPVANCSVTKEEPKKLTLNQAKWVCHGMSRVSATKPPV